VNKEQFTEAINSRYVNLRMMLVLRGIGGEDYSRDEANHIIYAVMKAKAHIKYNRLYAWDKCFVKGHVDHIANGYRELWDNGIDVPVTCSRCGRTEM